MKCADCKYVHRHEEREDWNYDIPEEERRIIVSWTCRRRSPGTHEYTYHPSSRYAWDNPPTAIFHGWPGVAEDDWCGEWEKADQK